MFDKLFKHVGAKIDKINSDDDFSGTKASNEIIGYDKLRLCNDLELPVGELTEFHSLTVVVSCMIKKGGKFILTFMLMKEFLMQTICKMKSLNIKNCSTYYPPVKLVHLMDFNLVKLGIKVVGTDELSIYYVTYDNYPFYLFVDDVKGFIKENSGAKYLTFSLRSKNFMYDNL